MFAIYHNQNYRRDNLLDAVVVGEAERKFYLLIQKEYSKFALFKATQKWEEKNLVSQYIAPAY